VENNREDMTNLIREMAIQNAKKIDLNDEICFVVAAYNEENVIADTINELISN
jgi:hypothetical protein